MFENWIKQLLKSALMAQASVQSFDLNERAADYFAQRALDKKAKLHKCSDLRRQRARCDCNRSISKSPLPTDRS